MNRIDAVAVDLDGTLLDPGGKIVAEARAALRDAHGQGVAVFVVTGRPFEAVVGFLEQNELLHSTVPDAIAAEERDLYDRAGNAFAPQTARNAQQLAAERALSAALMPTVRSLLGDLAAIDAEFTCATDEVIERRGFIEFNFKTMVAAEEAVRQLESALAGQRLRPTIIRNKRGVALRHPDAGKGRALQHLVLARGLRPSRVLAIGDSENDRSMLDGRYGFLAAAPANADPAIKALIESRGGYFAGQPCGRGVAEAIRATLA